MASGCELLGKSGGLDRPYLLTKHLIDTGIAAEVLWDTYLSARTRDWLREQLDVPDPRATIAYWAALHDLGKASPRFQRMIRGERFPTPGVRHDQITQACLHQVATNRAARRVAQLLGGHHGTYPEFVPSPEARAARGDQTWKVEQADVLGEITRLFPGATTPAKLGVGAAHVVAGLVILADWVVSDTAWLSTRTTSDDLDEHLASSQPVIRARCDAIGLRAPSLPTGEFEDMFPFEPAGIQADLIAARDTISQGGITVVMAATGEGKTEAALWAARLAGERNGTPGLYVALPTMATADQMHQRVSQWLTNTGTVDAPTLAHGLAALPRSADDPDTQADVAASWLAGPKRTLLAGVTVGTIDQVLVSVLRSRHNAVRTLGLAGKVLIVDEAHAYDPYMQALLARALSWLGHLRVPVVLCSATLPQRTATSLIDAYADGTAPDKVHYPGLIHRAPGAGTVSVPGSSRTRRSLVVRTVTHTHPDQRTENINDLLGGDDADGCVLVVCNTVSAAQSTYRAIRERSPQLDATLLHARFPVKDRARITDDVLRRFGKDRTQRPRRAVVVATQVIEQSLDVDFDTVVSDLAPLALLLQRAGRCQRHDLPRRAGRWTTPTLHILRPEDLQAVDQGAVHVYGRYTLTRTAELVAGLDRIRIPDDVQELVDSVYDRPEWSATPAEAHLAMQADEWAQRQLASVAAIPPATEVSDLHELTDLALDDDRARTRLGADGVRLLIVYTDDEGRWHLDPACEQPLPEGAAADPRLVIDHSIQAPHAPWMDAAGGKVPAWERSTWLRDIKVIPIPADGSPTPRTTITYQPGTTRSRTVEVVLDPELGLVVAS